MTGALDRPNPDYLGAAPDDSLLEPGQTLPVGGEAFIRIRVRANVEGQEGQILYNNAFGSAGSSEGEITEISTNGVDTDPETTGLLPRDNPAPDDNSDPTPIEVMAAGDPMHDIPTVGEWGLIALGLLLAFVAITRIRSPI